MAHPTAVILIVGLNGAVLRHAPRLQALAAGGRLRRLRPVLPAVTCSVQSSMLTGRVPADHGIVGNGWYDRRLAEVQFWKQSNHLVSGPKVWDLARRHDPSITVANLFWWYNMYSTVNFSVTPRPMYRADGRKIPDIYTEPPELRDELQHHLGRFPLFHFWGPAASIESSQWIADAAKMVHQRCRPTLTLVYLPHLDYPMQRLGPDHADMPAEVRAVDDLAGDLIDYLRGAGVRVMVLSEYGIEAVDDAVHINRVLREAGALRVRDEHGHELLDAGASDAFAVADHQVAHLYIKNPALLQRYTALCAEIPGIAEVLCGERRRQVGLDHPRSGDAILIADRGRWFSYYYWLDDTKAPDFARTVDIHRKPGYDPVELFLDPALTWPKLSVGWKLLRRRLGMRNLLNVIPLDASLVRGSHGRLDIAPDVQPILITESDGGKPDDHLPCTAVCEIVLQHLFGE